MPSTHKTQNLNLNNWTGEDKPKRDDWNSDNQKIDTAFHQISQNISAHSSNTSIHVTEEEKRLWASSGQNLSFFSYIGDGSATRSLSLNKKPSFGVVFAVNKPPIAVTPSFFTFCGFISTEGCASGLAVTSTGFSVNNYAVADPNGFRLSYNENGVKYICAYWTQA